MSVDLWIWVAFVGLILLLLALDLFVFHRDAHEVSFAEAARFTAFWVSLGLLFGALIWWWRGPDAAGQYLAGFLIEKALAVDNIFVFALIFGAFAVPARYQHRVLFWGVLGALVFRGAFIAGGAAILDAVHWSIYVFGAFLVVTGVRMARSRNEEPHPERNPAMRAFRRLVPTTDDYRGQRLTVREGGRRVATPLLAVLVIIETTDIVFAVDSIPAIFAVTRDPFLVFTSNAFAIMGLRTLYFLLAGMADRFRHLNKGLAFVLVFIGVKMLIADLWHVPTALSLGVIVAAITASVLASRTPAPAR
jgi:tellurite resistance protein TerC